VIPFLPAGTFTGVRLPGLVSAEWCRNAIARIEATGLAPTGAQYPDGYRNNDRAVFDDAALAASIFQLAWPRLPSELVVDGVRWRLEGLNPRFQA